MSELVPDKQPGQSDRGYMRSIILRAAMSDYEDQCGTQALAKLIVEWFRMHGHPKELRRHL